MDWYMDVMEKDVDIMNWYMDVMNWYMDVMDDELALAMLMTMDKWSWAMALYREQTDRAGVPPAPVVDYRQNDH